MITSNSKKIINLVIVVALSIILFFRFRVINGIDNFQLIQLYLRATNQIIYEDYGVLFGPGTSFLYIFFSKINFLNLSAINSVAAISLIVTLFTSHIICKIYEISTKKYDLFLFLISSITFYTSIGGYYNDHFSYAISLVGVYLYLKLQKNNFIKFFIIGIIFNIAFFFKTSFGLFVTISFVVSYLIEKKTINIFNKNLLSFYFGSIILFLLINIYFLVELNYNFFENTYLDSINTHILSGQKSFKQFVIALIFPFKINLFQLINDLLDSNGGLFRLIFYPCVLIFYLGIYIFFKKISKPSFIITYILLSSWLVISIAGKGSFYFLLCTSLLLFLVLDYFKKNFLIVKSTLLIYFIILNLLEFNDINPNFKKIESKSGTFYLSQKNTNFNLDEINTLKDFIKNNKNKNYVFTNDDLNFIPFLYNRPPSQYLVDIGQMGSYIKEKDFQNYWEGFFDFSEKSKTTIYYVLTSNKSIRDPDNKKIVDDYIIPIMKKRVIKKIAVINNLTIFESQKIN